MFSENDFVFVREGSDLHKLGVQSGVIATLGYKFAHIYDRTTGKTYKRTTSWAMRNLIHARYRHQVDSFF